jgi:hypothetical protein
MSRALIEEEMAAAACRVVLITLLRPLYALGVGPFLYWGQAKMKA